MNSVLQNHFIGNKASKINENFVFIENFKPESYCFEKKGFDV